MHLVSTCRRSGDSDDDKKSSKRRKKDRDAGGPGDGGLEGRHADVAGAGRDKPRSAESSDAEEGEL